MKEGTYYAENLEARRAYQRQYYLNNKEKVLRAQELRKFLNPDYRETMRRYNKDYYLRNREQILAKRRAKYKSRGQDTGSK